MSSKKHIIKYESTAKTYPNVLVQMKSLIPQWYKDLTLFHNNQLLDENDFQIKKTLKHCTPTLDAFINGYAITLPYDIVISYDNQGIPVLSGKHSGNPLAKVRGTESNKTRPIPHGYNRSELAWSLPLAFSVPIGCSFILTHPLNRFDLPFLTLSGIVDGGFVLNAEGDVPFYIREGFHGVIEKGTPIAQIIPFEHSRWKSEESKGLVNLGEITKENIGSKIVNSWYKSTWWVKKRYD